MFNVISSTNVKKWESELQTMKNNNTRLQAALEESKQHLSQWKAQLQKYKDENDSLKKKVRHAALRDPLTSSFLFHHLTLCHWSLFGFPPLFISLILLGSTTRRTEDKRRRRERFLKEGER